MPRDISKEQAIIRNGNRFVTEEGGNGVFMRDADRLFYQYRNLRWRIFRDHESKFNSDIAKDDLMAYINEQFIRLCKEYEINGEVDFAGYVKKVLNLRVKHVFIKNYFRDMHRETLGGTDNEVEELLVGEHIYVDNTVEAEDLFCDIQTHVKLNSTEMDLLTLMASGNFSNKELVVYASDKYDLPYRTTRRLIKKIRDQVADFLK